MALMTLVIIITTVFWCIILKKIHVQFLLEMSYVCSICFWYISDIAKTEVFKTDAPHSIQEKHI